MIDSHNHLQDPRLEEDLEEIVEALRREKIRKWLVNGTSESDWDRVALLADRYDEVIPFFGLHPWFCGKRSPEWLMRLREYLTRYPRSGIGEVGLDKWIRDSDFDDQNLVFREQLKLAAELKRPIAVHCLQAWGTLKERIDESGLGSRILIHSYGGPEEMVADFERSGVVLSISGYFFQKGKEKKLIPFSKISLDRLLIETDAPDMALPADQRKYCLPDGFDGEERNHPANLPVVYEMVSRLRKVDTEELRLQVQANVDSWLKRGFA